MTRASVIVPVHGQAELTRRCLDAVLAALPARCELIVVDDASPDATPELLRGYGEAIRVVTLAENGGFARACNAGAEAAAGEALVFLNNDTEPVPGWLQALLAYAEREPAAEVVGAKLVYPTGLVQHAGVVFGQDGYPHHLYAGLAAEHPAVNRSRRLQAVTGACMLVRRGAFKRAGGFDDGYENSLEDVDLCLRIGAAGGEVHYCHGATVVHLESASRGRSDRFARSVALYQERWRDRIRRDDLAAYAEDGLLEVEYPASYPLRMTVSPQLASIDAGREAEIEDLLETYARQTSNLLAEVMRLTALAGARLGGGAAVATNAETDHRALLAETRRLETQARDLQERFAVPAGKLGYRALVDDVAATVERTVPPGAGVLVVSRGDRDLVRFPNREAAHFPQDEDGGYLGHHPADSAEAIARLERLREGGAEYLVVPATSRWWLDHYEEFDRHLRRRYELDEQAECTIVRLTARDREPIGGRV
jgi:GT2 family glycosyltransferase